MTEHEQIWLDWEQGKRAAMAVSGQPAVVCIMGSQTYRAFRAAVEMKVGACGWYPLRCEGLNVYPSQIMPLGMVFGHLEPKGFC